MSKSVKKVSEIKLKVGVDENNVPIQIEWSAEDGGVESVAKAIMLSLWDEKEGNTMRIDLWTKDMLVDEMKQFYHQSIMTMADTFERATGENDMAKSMRDFGAYFAEKLKLMSPGEN